MGYVIAVRNGLDHAVELHVEDQVPVITRDEIDIELQEMTRAPMYEEDTGQLTGDLTLAPSGTETLRVLYEISAPKAVRVSFE